MYSYVRIITIAVAVCDWIWESMYSSHIQYCSFGDPYRPQKLVYKFETFKDDKGILVQQYLKVSCLFVILDRFYELRMLGHWMCELFMFSQLQSYIHCIFFKMPSDSISDLQHVIFKSLLGSMLPSPSSISIHMFCMLAMLSTTF